MLYVLSLQKYASFLGRMYLGRKMSVPIILHKMLNHIEPVFTVASISTPTCVLNHVFVAAKISLSWPLSYCGVVAKN